MDGVVELLKSNSATAEVLAPPAVGLQPEKKVSAAGSIGIWSERQVARVLLLVSLVIGAITHGYHLFLYPLYTTDEGIYVEQAWAVLREGRLSPYTYFYDHAPGGWLAIAGWVNLLPRQFETFGNPINSGRVLILLVHLGSVFLLFTITKRLSGSYVAAFVAAFLFNVSPLAVFYQRQVLLDNLMVLWVLLSLYLLTRDDGRLVTTVLAGLSFGVAVVTKENAIFFAPVLFYLLYKRLGVRLNRRFALGFWSFFAAGPVAAYFLYAALKNELFPSRLSFDLNNPPADHVSLLYTIWWQLHRSKGSILDRHSLFWQFSLDSWLPKDHFILIAGGAAMLINLYLGLRRRNLGLLVASLLAISYTLYLARGSMVLEFYVVPLLPLLALNIGMLTAEVLRAVRLPQPAQLVAVAALVGALVLPIGGGYVVAKGNQGGTVLHDLYRLPLTDVQTQQVAYIRQHIPPDSRIIGDDDLWVALHDVKPYYRFAHSHWKAAADPDVRDKLFGKNWRNVDYIVMSNQMLTAIRQNNGDGSEDWILEAIGHAKPVWTLQRGGVSVGVYQVDKQS
jgi:4-amino-4-deoxy-L-arabinose transferase-like glycosyltransferase